MTGRVQRACACAVELPGLLVKHEAGENGGKKKNRREWEAGILLQVAVFVSAFCS